MPSKFKTEFLELNSWEETDRPTRSDFVSDNAIIDSVLGGHIRSVSAHLTQEEKQRVQRPFFFKMAMGTNEETRTFKFDFDPQIVIMFASGASPVELVDGNIKVNFCIAVRNYGGSGNCTLGSTGFTVHQKTNGSIISNLNNSDYQYVIVAFR